MQTRALPHTGLTVSRACYGTMTFGMQSDQALSTRLVSRCMDAGINFFDTGERLCLRTRRRPFWGTRSKAGATV